MLLSLLRKRLRKPVSPAPRSFPLGLTALATVGVLLGTAAGCGVGDNPLAPYEGGRPLELLRVTQSFTPEVQWVGGRVAAVGVNRGTEAALDESLVWLQTAAGNSIGSFVTVGQNTDVDRVRQLGGVPVDSLEDGETYTVWVAEQGALDAGLDPARMDPAAFADTTLTMSLVLRGRSGRSADLDVTFEITRDESLLDSRFLIRWTPEDVRFCRLAIRTGNFGAFTDLLWHVVVPEGEPCMIAPPVTVGVPPEGTEVAVPFSGREFAPTNYTLWATTEDWNETFNPFQAQGYAFFLILGSNFED